MLPRRDDLCGLCLIIDQDLLQSSPDQAMTQALEAGVRFFQYRSKNGTRRQVYDAAARLVKIAHRSGALFLVNDHADIAAAVDADGVHLGQEDLPLGAARRVLGKDRLIGISTHSQEQAVQAEAGGADYIGFGPMFSTRTKDAGAVQGLERLALIKQTVRVPVVAIGGINQDTMHEVLQAGADGIAVISAILTAQDVQKAAASMVNVLRSFRRVP